MLDIPENLKQTMKERYYQPGETAEHMIRRVVNYILDGEKKYGVYSDSSIEALKDIYIQSILEKKWIPSSPFLMNAGTRVPMLSACFAVGGLEDSLSSIYRTVKRQGIINKMGGGTGFNFSELREKGADIKSTGGTSSGVMSFMELFNTNGEIIKQGGKRRSANIGILSVYHPEIINFINYKLDLSKLTNFNISVLVDNVFMEKVKNREDYELISPATGESVCKLNAYDVYMSIMKNNWKSAEPALLFLDNMNLDNAMIDYLGYMDNVNPCGELVMYDNESCNLASINLERFVDWDGSVNWDDLRLITSIVTRFLDTAIDVNLFPDEIIEEKTKSLRRLGVGIMGLHGALIKAGLKYSSQEGRRFAEKLMKTITGEAWRTSEQLAEERGVFPLWEYSSFAKKGKKVRNVSVTTIAPTGTISQILDSSSSGCEPIFGLAYKRIITDKQNNKHETFWVNSFFKECAKKHGFWSDDLPKKIHNNMGSAKGIQEIPERFQELFETAMEISPSDHVKMQSALQRHVTNSISKTINLPQNATIEEIAKAYMLGWELGLKGMTVYRDGSRDEQVLSVGESEKSTSKNFNFNTIKPVGRISLGKTYGSTVRKRSACGKMYITINRDKEGNIVESFVNVGKNGICKSNIDGINRLISLNLRSGVKVDEIIRQLKGINCPACTKMIGQGKKDKISGISCPDIIARALKEEYEGINETKSTSRDNKNNEGKCPKCGAYLNPEGGCFTCLSCGYSKCS